MAMFNNQMVLYFIYFIDCKANSYWSYKQNFVTLEAPDCINQTSQLHTLKQIRSALLLLV